jgi:hypothetical protein
MLRASLGKVVHTVKKAGSYAAKVPAQELHKIAVRVRAVIRTQKKTLEGIEHILISLQRETAIFFISIKVEYCQKTTQHKIFLWTATWFLLFSARKEV